jgi:predicted nuclease with TOPRIM domain
MTDAPRACKNTDREIWRDGDGEGYYTPDCASIFVTEDGGIGISVNGNVIVRPVREWHRALSQAGGEHSCPRCGSWHNKPELGWATRRASPSPSVSVERERETQRLDICASCGQPFRSCKCFNAPDTPQSVPTCTCSKHPLWDGYDGDCPIHGWFESVTPDAPLSQGEELPRLPYLPDCMMPDGADPCEGFCELQTEWQALIAERDQLKEQRDKWCKAYEDCANEHKALVERVGVLEKVLKKVIMDHEELSPHLIGMPLNVANSTIDEARAALRTSEESMTPEEVKAMMPCWGEADWCRDMRNCVCKQNIEAAIYEDAAKIAEGDKLEANRKSARAALELCEQNYERLEAERDKLKADLEQCGALLNAELDNTERMVERVSVLEDALRIADISINPPDRDGISLNIWNARLAGATSKIRAALTRTSEDAK